VDKRGKVRLGGKPFLGRKRPSEGCSPEKSVNFFEEEIGKRGNHLEGFFLKKGVSIKGTHHLRVRGGGERLFRLDSQKQAGRKRRVEDVKEPFL